GGRMETGRTRRSVMRARAIAESVVRPTARPRHPGIHKTSAQASTKRAMRTVDTIKVAAVAGRPAFTKSFIVTETPSREATCTTITLHAAPKIVALPAKAELAPSASPRWGEACGTTSARSKTAGTLTVTFERSEGRSTIT